MNPVTKGLAVMPPIMAASARLMPSTTAARDTIAGFGWHP